MEFNTTLVGVIILLLIFVPIALMIRSSSGKAKKVKKTLLQISKSKGVELKDIDVIGNLIIGLDASSKKLVYSSVNNLQNDMQIIAVNDLKICRTKAVHQSGDSLEWVGLELTGPDGKHEIAFYDDANEDGGTQDPLLYLQDAARCETTLRPFLKAS